MSCENNEIVLIEQPGFASDILTALCKQVWGGGGTFESNKEIGNITPFIKEEFCAFAT